MTPLLCPAGQPGLERLVGYRPLPSGRGNSNPRPAAGRQLGSWTAGHGRTRASCRGPSCSGELLHNCTKHAQFAMKIKGGHERHQPRLWTTFGDCCAAICYGHKENDCSIVPGDAGYFTNKYQKRKTKRSAVAQTPSVARRGWPTPPGAASSFLLPLLPPPSLPAEVRGAVSTR